MRKVAMCISVLFVLLSVSCECTLSPVPLSERHSGPGWVRSVHELYNIDDVVLREQTVETEVVFESKNGGLRTLVIMSHKGLPLWVGMYCDIEVDDVGRFVAVTRLGPDSGKEETDGKR